MGCQISPNLVYGFNLPTPAPILVTPSRRQPAQIGMAASCGGQFSLAMTVFIFRTRVIYSGSARGQRIICPAGRFGYAPSPNAMKYKLMKIVSGGQTGVDRAALDFAIRHGCEHGGWCPRGRLAEDGVIPPIYQLRETDSADYDERTEKNVVDSDATLIVTRERKLSGGTAFTKTCAEQHDRPLLLVYESDGLAKSATALSNFLKRHRVRTLNVAGPRESQAPGIGKFVMELLATALARS